MVLPKKRECRRARQLSTSSSLDDARSWLLEYGTCTTNRSHSKRFPAKPDRTRREGRNRFECEEGLPFRLHALRSLLRTEGSASGFRRNNALTGTPDEGSGAAPSPDRTTGTILLSAAGENTTSVSPPSLHSEVLLHRSSATDFPHKTEGRTLPQTNLAPFSLPSVYLLHILCNPEPSTFGFSAHQLPRAERSEHERTPQKKTPVSVAGCFSAIDWKIRSQFGRPYCVPCVSARG